MAKTVLRTILSVPRPYLVLILTLVASVFMFQGFLKPQSAQSLVTAYRWQISSGQSYGGFTTNWTEACGNEPSLSSLRVTTMTTAAFPCDDRIQRTASSVPADMLLMIKPTAYSSPTLVKGQSTGNRWYLRDGGSANNKVVRFSLGYVSGAIFTAFGSVDVTVNNGTRALYQPNMSSIQGTAPAGSFLAVKVTIQSDTSDYLRIYLADSNASGDQSGQISVDETAGDTTAPTVNAFTMPSTATSLTVPVSSFTATDAVGVTGYLITESATAPTAGAAGWTATPPASFTFIGEGTRTAYAWAKDAAGNVSASRSATVTITPPDTTAPTVSAFTMPSTATSLTVPVSTFTGSDNVGVTGYLITENATAPAPGGGGWTATAPASFTFSGYGTRTAYAWARDAAGNVSASRSATVTINDATAPTITSFAMTTPVTSPINVLVTAFTATDNVGVAGYIITESATPPSIAAAGWTATAPAMFSFSRYGNRNAYAWTKDAAGNVSTSAAVTVTINDAAAPSLTVFAMPTTATSLTVTITAFTATDNVGITGWLVKENSTAPLASDAGWLASQPSSYSFAAQGLRTAYAWVKDAAGNISNMLSADVTITLPDTTAPTVNSFTMPGTATSLTVPVSTLTASDNVGVTGYLITESATAPAAGAAGWTETTLASFTFSGEGTRTAYAWAKDAAGNVSASRSATVTITLPDNRTVAGTASATAGTSSIGVTAPYTGDPNANNSLLVEYKLASAGTYTTWQTISHAASPYTTTITGLQASTSYTVRVTYQDSDGIVGTAQQEMNVATPSAAVTGTTAGTVSGVASSTSSITLTAPYSNDDNGSNTLLVEYKLTTAGTYTTWQTLPHAASPYTATITGLQANSAYNVRTTYQDSDGVTGNPVQVVGVTTPLIDTPLMHSGPNLQSKYGSWGADRDCSWCHNDVTNNIKMVLETIETPIGSRPVVFSRITASQMTTPGTFGNDQRLAANQSQNVCEVCHHQTKFHQYSAVKLAVTSHYNNRDCTLCHTHRSGFRYDGAGGCTACHGNPPLTTAELATGAITFSGQPGSHQAHSQRGMECLACHANSNGGGAMTSGDDRLQIGFNVTSTTVPGFKGSVATGSFSGNGNYPSWETAAGTSLTLAPDTVTCSIYCHGGWSGSNGQISTPSWVGANQTSSCNACHGDAASPPATGSHTRHVASQGFSCSDCHGPQPADTTHVNGQVIWQMPGSGLYKGFNRYSSLSQPLGGSYGSCSNIYCHSDVQGSGGNGSPAVYGSAIWGNAGSVAGCAACHQDMQTTGTASHVKHTARYACATCHNGAGSGSTRHADSYIDVSFSGSGSGTSYSQPRTPAGSDGYGSCSNIACHNNNSAQWGSTLTCVGCHPLAALQASGAHGRHVTATPSFYNFTASRSTSVAYDFGCSNCHPQDSAKHANGTLDVTINSINTGSGGAVGYLRSRNGATTDGLAAGNGPSGVFGTSGANVRCSASYCHSNGYAANLKFMVSPDWYGPAYTGDKCAMCHGNSPNASDPVNQPGSPAHYSRNFLGFSNVSGGHVTGIHTNNIFTGTVGLANVGNTPTSSHGNGGTATTINCNMCHYATVTTYANDRNKACVACHGTVPQNPADLIADKRIHVSGRVDVAFNPIRVRSKAQLREQSYDQTLWSRQVGYKQSGSHDIAFKSFSTVTQWDGANKTCSNIACHNGKTVKWGDTGGATSCHSCHDRL